MLSCAGGTSMRSCTPSMSISAAVATTVTCLGRSIRRTSDETNSQTATPITHERYGVGIEKAITKIRNPTASKM